MGLETAESSEASVASNTVDVWSPIPPPRKRPKALDPDARDRAAKRAKVTRVVKRFKAARSEEQLQEMMREHLGERAPARPSAAAETPVPAGELVQASSAIVPMIGIWAMVQKLAQGTRFQISDEQVNALALGTQPAADKYLGGALNTPEALATVTILAVFGKPLFELAEEKLGGKKPVAEQTQQSPTTTGAPPAGVVPPQAVHP